MRSTRAKERWIFRYGVWIRRALMAIAFSIPLIGKASGFANNSPASRYGLFAVIGLCGTCLVLYVVEYLLAVRRRGYWFDHRLD